MKRWAVTGPMGAGKSTFTSLLADRGAAVVDGDELGHRILARGRIKAEIASAFGDGVVGADGVDKRALGRLVFASATALGRLNAITHGPLSELAAAELDGLARRGRHELAVLDAAVYFLLPQPPPVELVIAVVAADRLRRERMVRRTGLPEAEIRRRLAAQEPMHGLWRQADVVLTNDGSPEVLRKAADELWSRHFPDPRG